MRPKPPETLTTVLLLDGENYHLMAVLQCLSKVKNLRLIIISDKPTSSMRYSRFVWKYIHCAMDAKNWVNKINDCIGRYQVDVVMPIAENTLEMLIQYKNRLQVDGKVLVPETLKELDEIRDKRLLALHMSDIGIAPPTFWAPTKNRSDGLKSLSKHYPVLAKPAIISGGGMGIVKLKNEEELRDFLSNHDSGKDYLIQEFIEGHDLGCNVICRDGEVMAYTIQVGNMFLKKAYTPQVGLDMVHNEEVIKIVKNLMKSLRWNGVANVDMRYDNLTGQYYVLEVNPRYWLTLLASCMAGVNFPWLYCRIVLDDKFQLPDFKEIDYWNLKRLPYRLKKDPMLLFRWKYLWNNTPLGYLINDPTMTVYHYSWTLKNIIASMSNKIFNRQA
ncbi:ATP-grasp domain-containing protein [Flagellimonas lutimaris]|uniref:ATP-grasp domain-containing protein n=1 Tax=Flagellimonas lutimaris TaxID=475082 RepID=UPI003F5CE4CD